MPRTDTQNVFLCRESRGNVAERVLAPQALAGGDAMQGVTSPPSRGVAHHDGLISRGLGPQAHGR
jgi:hypothetical protein